MKIRILTAALLAGLSASALAFDLGSALQKLQDPNVQKAMSVGKKMVDANREIGEAEEITIGQGITANLLGAAPLVQDEALQKYVNRVGLWVALQSERPGLPWKFGVVETETVNAFSMPGGTILITRGLYEKLRNESELAGVLGHEIAHVLRKHQLKAIQGSLGNEWRAEVAQAVAEHKANKDADYAVRAFGAGTELFSRGLDKGDEFEADRMGVVLAARAGYNPYGLVGVLQTLDAVNPQDGGVALMFKTHPAPAKRQEMLTSAMGEKLDAYAEQADSTPRFRLLKK